MKPPPSLRPRRKHIELVKEYGRDACTDMDCSHCCEDESAVKGVKGKSVESEVKQGLHPFGDQDMDRDGENAVELEEEAEAPLPPPPDMPEDLDGNWMRQRRQRDRALPKPITPTKDERARHRLTHIPYADWCRHCVRCRGRNLPHRKIIPLPAENVVPVMSIDLGHIKRHEAEKKLPFIVARDHRTKVTFAHLLRQVHGSGGLFGLCGELVIQRH